MSKTTLWRNLQSSRPWRRFDLSAGRNRRGDRCTAGILTLVFKGGGQVTLASVSCARCKLEQTAGIMLLRRVRQGHGRQGLSATGEAVKTEPFTVTCNLAAAGGACLGCAESEIRRRAFQGLTGQLQCLDMTSLQGCCLGPCPI